MSLPHKKNFLRDVLPKNPVNSQQEESSRENEVIYYREPEQVQYKEKNASKWGVWLLASGAVLALTVSILYVFSSAEVTIVPRVDEARFENNFKAKKEPLADVLKNELGYVSTHIEKLGSKNVTADGEKLQEKKSSGKIIVYNNFSTKEQKLIKNTRFESPQGLIFRIDQSIVVPPQKSVNGKIEPGSIEVTVYADEPGVKYNIGPSDFSIPGFKSDAARYKGFYAKSFSGMAGGFSGMAKYVSAERQDAERTNIRAELEKQILAEAEGALKEGYFIPDGAYTIEFESEPVVPALDDMITLKEKAKVSVYSFNKQNWDKFLAMTVPFGQMLGSSTVMIQNRSDLAFSWKGRPSPESVEISFGLKGNARFVWLPDETKVAASLSGVKRSDLEATLSNYKEILRATASIAPFWSMSFPKDPSKIEVKTDMP